MYILMSLSRRAIIHIGGSKKTHREQLPQRMLPTKQTNLLNNTPNDPHFYFTIKLNDKKHINVLKGNQIDELLEPGQERPKDLRKVKKYDILISTDEQHKLIQKQMDKKQKNAIIQRIKQAKQMNKKIKEDTKKRNGLGLSKILMDCEMDIEYYNNIKTKFEQFEKKFYIQTTDPKHKYNPFRFSLNKDYNTPITFEHNAEGWATGIEDWRNNNKINKKNTLYKEWSQIARDMNRNLLNIQTVNKNAYFDENIWNSQLLFYFSQLALFTSYFYYEHDKKKVENRNNQLSGADFQKSEFYNSYILQNYKKNGTIDESEFQKFVNDDIKKNKNKNRKEVRDTIYGQEEFETFLGVLFATSDPDNKKYNIIDAVALYTYIYQKQDIKFFYENIFRGIDKKKRYQNILKIMSIFDIVDPFLFKDFFDIIETQNKDDESDFGKGNFWNKRLGETFIQHTNHFDSKKASPWMESEKSKYDIFHNSANKSMADIINDIKNLAAEELNKPLEALLKSNEKSDKMDDIANIITITEKDPYGKSKRHFSNGDTKIEMITTLLQQIIMFNYGRGVFKLHFKNNNEHLHVLNHYYKSLYKYGVTGFILYMAIHLKNIRTSVHVGKKNKLPLQIIKEKLKDKKQDHITLLDSFLLENIPDIVKKEQNLGYIAALMYTSSNSPFYTQRESGKNINFPYNTFINPMTTNVTETYNKHFDFFIDHIKNSNGSIEKYETEWDKLFDKSLILYRNGYIKKERIDTIKKNHQGITIVNNINEIWDKHKKDNRISFKKAENHPGEILIKMDKGWLGDVTTDTLRNALDGVYHICYNTFMKDVDKLLKPIIKKNTFVGLWPKNSGRPFIFVNKLYGDEKDPYYELDRVDFFNDKDVKKKLIGIGKPLPNYWFNTKNMFTTESKERNDKLKPLFDEMKPKIASKETAEWNDFSVKLFGITVENTPSRASSSESNSSEDSVGSKESVDSIETKDDPTDNNIDTKDVPLDRNDSTNSDGSLHDEPVDLTDEMQEHADDESKKIEEELREKAEEQKRELERQTEEINILQDGVDRRNDIITGNNDDADEQSKDDNDEQLNNNVETNSYKEKQKKIRNILKDKYNAVIEEVEDNGDCLFQALENGLFNNGAPAKTHKQLRQDIVTHVMDNWTDYENFIIIEQEDGTKRYKTKEDYENQMGQKWKTDKNIPRKPQAHFGGEVEIQAFLKLYPEYNIQILKYEDPNMVELPPFEKENIGKEKIITLFLSDLHYQNLKKIDNQSGGSNNVYINKCKNHRHNRTKKFRMKLKDIGNWIYLEPRKKKKHTRKKY
jgi:hypothetical protein